MNGLPDGPRGRALAVGLALVMVASLYLAVIAPVLSWYADRADTLARQRTLGARMEAIAATLPELKRAAASQAGAAPAPLTVLQGTSDALAGAELQGRVQEIAQGAGATLSSLETLPTEARGAYRRIALRISLAGPWPVVVRLVGGIAEASPKMLLDEVQFRGSPMRPRAPGSAVDASMVVIAFRAGP